MMMIIGIVAVVILLAVGTFFILRNKEDEEIMPRQSPVMNFNNPMVQQTTVAPTVVNQWTDQSGHSWRSMSDGTTLWWNGRDWQKT